MMGFPAQVRSTDDPVIHITCIAQFVARKADLQEPITPEQARLLIGHVMQHAEQMKQAGKSAELKQLTQQFGPVMQFLQQLAQRDQVPAQGQPQPAPQPQPGVVP
jgi:hypothetical protein